MSRRLAPLLAAVALLLIPSFATAANAGSKGAATQVVPDATVKVKVGHLRDGRAQIYGKVPVFGTVSPYVPGQRVEVSFFLNGKELVSHKLAVGKGSGGKGSFRSSVIVREDGKYAVSATHEATAVLGGDSSVRKSWKVSFPALHQGQCGDVVVGFKKAMREMGYIANSGRCFGGKTGRGVLAYRKVNDMTRSSRAGKGLVESVFAGRGGYHVLHPNAGEHVEAPLSKQVLVFTKGDKPFAIYPVSSGKPSTPTVMGTFHFYMKEPGTNAKGMLDSNYFIRGYAIHGYPEVPAYAASHGCLRIPNANAAFVFGWVNVGDRIDVYR